MKEFIKYLVLQVQYIYFSICRKCINLKSIEIPSKKFNRLVYIDVEKEIIAENMYGLMKKQYRRK